MSTRQSTLDSVTDATFAAEVLGSDLPVLVEFGASWCPPCRMIEPVLEAISSDLADRLRVVTMDTDDQPLTASALGVLGLPTLHLYVNGVQVLNLVGAKPKAMLLRALEPHLG
ncbi:thiol reductase thioredoxin [Nakamurella silvestris]|nr:thiol reductase thioredoxin [Nakamurella silvestris]